MVGKENRYSANFFTRAFQAAGNTVPRPSRALGGGGEAGTRTLPAQCAVGNRSVFLFLATAGVNQSRPAAARVRRSVLSFPTPGGLGGPRAA